MDTFDKSLTFLSDNKNNLLILILSSNIKLNNLIDLQYEDKNEELLFTFKIDNKKYKKNFKLEGKTKYDFNWNKEMYILDHDTINKVIETNKNIENIKNIKKLKDNEILNIFQKADLTKYKIKKFEK